MAEPEAVGFIEPSDNAPLKRESAAAAPEQPRGADGRYLEKPAIIPHPEALVEMARDYGVPEHDIQEMTTPALSAVVNAAQGGNRHAPGDGG